MKPVSLPPQAQQCEPLFALLAGSHGRLSVGQMLKGTDAGRVVMLRELPDANERIAAAVDIARSIAHPHVSKVLGIVRGKRCFYVASEYTPGVTLQELATTLRKQQTRLNPAAAARIVREALRAAAVAEQLLAKTAGLGYARALFLDTIWIAEYGDVLVTEVGLAPLLNERHAASSALDAQARDIVAACVELFQLCTGQLMTMDVAAKLQQLPPDLARVVKRALIQPGSFGGPSGFCAALEALPPALHGSEQQVADEVRRIMRATLETRRHTLNALRQCNVQIGEDEVTHFSRPSGLVISTTRDTARPPRGAPAPTIFGVQGELEDRTTIFRRSPAPTPMPRPPVSHGSEPPRSPRGSNPSQPRWGRRRWWAFAVLAVVALLAALFRRHYLD